MQSVNVATILIKVPVQVNCNTCISLYTAHLSCTVPVLSSAAVIAVTAASQARSISLDIMLGALGCPGIDCFAVTNASLWRNRARMYIATECALASAAIASGNGGKIVQCMVHAHNIFIPLIDRP